jgi:hypothetical protein
MDVKYVITSQVKWSQQLWIMNTFLKVGVSLISEELESEKYGATSFRRPVNSSKEYSSTLWIWKIFVEQIFVDLNIRRPYKYEKYSSTRTFVDLNIRWPYEYDKYSSNEYSSTWTFIDLMNTANICSYEYSSTQIIVDSNIPRPRIIVFVISFFPTF